MMAAVGRVRLERYGPHIAAVTLDRPSKRNALDRAMLDDLDRIARDVDDEIAIRAVILASADDRAFCVGADIEAWSGLSPLDMGRRWVREGHRLFDRLANLRVPMIAAIDGPALGGGLELALTADIRVAGPSARFALPEAKIGIVPGWSGTQRLVAAVGAQAARRMAMTGETLEADEAHRIGLVDHLAAADDGSAFATARAIAETTAGLAPTSVQLAKQMINARVEGETGSVIEALAGSVAASTDACRTGVSAFRDKRAAEFDDE